ncbi:hypothetical protein RHOFW510R12_00115 [Rhodanobacter sp. FW510-R12]|uniref:DUF2149 domain-containing protein n=1 Tax=unclassified Rhodanobacter TaxID=2621553 RepID=UPI0007AA044F|nr:MULTISPECIES: DUF2149 domain-containing protein [unclassified Rhodanobacter]KZC15601.1 hypothetical protein RHOFW104R8_04130 [Rhodanobacter sp. FW104-R8]KZC28312.1 hypothetical protein RhoFW510T8_11670 [Rhodanobacter sp. FW510-T8]KZC32687.1 hypothetical protein RhoFW510R10_11190 [Rhodanobacter sp. FW510-R10]
MNFLDDSEADDPILSVVNLIDIFLVVIAALLLTMAKNPVMQMMQSDNVTVITDPGKASMQMLVKRGEKIERFRSTGQVGQGEGTKAGVAYRMKDGSVVYVPEAGRQGGDAARDAGGQAPAN